LLVPVEAGQYPRGVAAAVLLSLDSVQAGDDSGGCGPVMDLLAVLSPAGVRRSMLHALCRAGFLWQGRRSAGLSAEVADRVLGRLAGASLLTFNVAGTTASAHRLVMRVTRERQAAQECLAQVCMAAAQVLDGLAGSLRDSWHRDRPAVRDLIEQITALGDSADCCPADEDLGRRVIRLRWWAAGYLGYLGDSTAQAILMGEQLVADHVRLLGPDHPDTLTSRNNLANAYQEAGRTAEAITLHEQTLADRERLLGPDHPDTLTSRNNLANAYRAAGRTAEAITLHERVPAVPGDSGSEPSDP
jgi:tetratricopeptide (TPR) repeat protein